MPRTSLPKRLFLAILVLLAIVAVQRLTRPGAGGEKAGADAAQVMPSGPSEVVQAQFLFEAPPLPSGPQPDGRQHEDAIRRLPPVEPFVGPPVSDLDQSRGDSAAAEVSAPYASTLPEDEDVTATVGTSTLSMPEVLKSGMEFADSEPSDVEPNYVGPNDVEPNDVGPNDAVPHATSEYSSKASDGEPLASQEDKDDQVYRLPPTTDVLEQAGRPVPQVLGPPAESVAEPTKPTMPWPVAGDKDVVADKPSNMPLASGAVGDVNHDVPYGFPVVPPIIPETGDDSGIGSGENAALSNDGVSNDAVANSAASASAHDSESANRDSTFHLLEGSGQSVGSDSDYSRLPPVEEADQSVAVPTIPLTGAITETSNSELAAAAKRRVSPPVKDSVAARQAGRLVAHGFALANRGALYAARAEFLQALDLIVEERDAVNGNGRSAEALAAAWQALSEADDFLPKSSRGVLNRDIQPVVEMHRTTVLHAADLTGINSIVALQRYYTFARNQLAEAVHGEPVAAQALFALGKLHMLFPKQSPSERRRNGQKAVAFHQAALMVHPRDHLAANELGVLLARAEQYEFAKEVFLQSLTVMPRAETWHNLAAVHRVLGESELQRRAQYEKERMLGEKKVAPRNDSMNSGVQWISPARVRS